MAYKGNVNGYHYSLKNYILQKEIQFKALHTNLIGS